MVDCWGQEGPIHDVQGFPCSPGKRSPRLQTHPCFILCDLSVIIKCPEPRTAALLGSPVQGDCHAPKILDHGRRNGTQLIRNWVGWQWHLPWFLEACSSPCLERERGPQGRMTPLLLAIASLTLPISIGRLDRATSTSAPGMRFCNITPCQFPRSRRSWWSKPRLELLNRKSARVGQLRKRGFGPALLFCP